ncbi:alpha/beta fold hydrolase [Patulibacter medicamentivorans]|jgi:pimeloyl-ACP methyl ester carboxylesterase|uniref:alpha/beta fold hydrolase n=1 Tax=Patulibacter medicamentivorans TaxID=1097667 RepID=UPI00058DCBF6|nr:alpha/beta hydrolase [Patulibacter medicamentivorans]
MPRVVIDERSVEIDGVRTRLLELAGPGLDGPPLLLLHGFTDSADTWRPVMLDLAARGQRSVAIDLPGFGQADRLLPDEPMLPQYVRLVAGLSALIGDGEAPVIAGNSMGGATALLAAEGRPSPAGIIPIDPAGFDHPRWFQLIDQQPLLRFLLSDVNPVPTPLVRMILAQVFRQLAFAHPLRARREVLARFTQHYETRRDVRRILHTGRRLLPELLEPFDHSLIECPVLLIWGDRDRMVSHRGSRHLLAALPSTEYELLADVGHCPQLEVPARVGELIHDFCVRVRDTPTEDPRREVAHG